MLLGPDMAGPRTLRDISERLNALKVPSRRLSRCRGTQLPLFARLSTLMTGSLHANEMTVNLDFKDALQIKKLPNVSSGIRYAVLGGYTTVEHDAITVLKGGYAAHLELTAVSIASEELAFWRMT